MFLVISMFLLPFEVMASCNSNSCSGNNAVTKLYPTTSGDVNLLSDVENYSNLDCNLTTSQAIVLRRSHRSFKEIYSNILVAMAMDMKLRVRVSASKDPCEVVYVWIEK